MPSPRNSFSAVASSLRGAFARLTGGVWPGMGGTGWGRVRLLFPGARFDWEREAGDPWANSVVALGLAWIGDRVARPRLVVSRVGRGGNLVELPRHGILDLWNRPNPYYGRRTLEKAIALSLKVDGNAYLHKVRDNGGRVCQLWWIPHYRVEPTWPADRSEFIDGYRITVDGFHHYVDRSEIIHIRDGIDPRNERLGMAALKANLREVCTINYESTYTAALLKNSGVPSVAIVPDGDERGPADQAQADRMADRWMDTVSGDDAGRPAVFAGRYKVVEVGFSPDKLVLDKLPQAAQARLAASVGTAAMSLGLSDPNKTYANLAEANRTSWGTIVAVQELTAEAVRDGLAGESIQVGGRVTPPSDPLDLVVAYDYSHVQELQESLDSLHARTREDFKADLITRNEAREQLGYDADDGSGDVYFSEIQAAAGPTDPGVDDDEPTEPTETESETDGAKAWRY